MKSQENNITESLVDKVRSTVENANYAPGSPSWEAFQAYSDAKASARSLRMAALYSLLISAVLIAVVVYTWPEAQWAREVTKTSEQAKGTSDSVNNSEGQPGLKTDSSFKAKARKEVNTFADTVMYELPEYTKKAKSASAYASYENTGAQVLKPGSFVKREEELIDAGLFRPVYQMREDEPATVRLKPEAISHIPYPIEGLNTGAMAGISAMEIPYADSVITKVRKPYILKATTGLPIAFARTAIDNWISITFKNWTVGLEYERPLSGRFSFRGGLNFLHLDQRYDLRNPVEADDTTVDFQHIRFNAFVIPLGIKYDFRKDRTGWYLSGGMSTYNYIRREDTFQYRWFGPGIRNINQTSTLKKGFSFSNTNLFSTADVALGRHTNIGKLGIEWEAFGSFPVFEPSPDFSLAFTDLVTWGFNLKFAIKKSQ